MVCIICGGNTNVTNSRHQVRVNATWRRRKCAKCDSIFTTIEMADLSANWLVAKENHTLEPFLQEKLFLSVYESCRHRLTAIEDAKYITANAISQLTPHINNGVARPESIVHVVGTALTRFDNVASVHYLAFHKLPKSK